jgi:O-methyltransferase
MMEFFTSLNKRFRNLAKKIPFIAKAYKFYYFLKRTPRGDFFNLVTDISKVRLVLTVWSHTLLDYPPLLKLYELACRFEKDAVSGSFVECGVYNGGSAAAIATAAKKGINRHVWLFDSWEGFPEPDARDIDRNMIRAEKGGCLGFEEKVRDLLFRRLHLDSTRVHLVKGWFADTLPRSEIGPIALLHLDCDLYESVKLCLEQLYTNLIPGGCVCIDDYGYFRGCKEAVHEFTERRNLKVKLIKYGRFGAYFYKES